MPVARLGQSSFLLATPPAGPTGALGCRSQRTETTPAPSTRTPMYGWPAVYFDLAAALPPLLPAALCCAWVPPWLLLPDPECDFSPPCLDALGEFAILAARSLDMPLSLSASYC